MAKSILPYVVLGASDALDNPNINLLFSSVSLKLIYPSPFILSVEKVPLPPHALLVLIVVLVLFRYMKTAVLKQLIQLRL
jgi:hypothetical protein